MVHGKSGIKFCIMPESEESVRRIRSESQDTFIIRRFHGRKDYALLLVPEQSSVPAVWIQPENGNLGLQDTEIPFQRGAHQSELADYRLNGNRRRNGFQRNMSGNNTDLELVGNHEHRNILDSELLLKVLRVTGVAEAFVHHRPLVDRGGD